MTAGAGIEFALALVGAYPWLAGGGVLVIIGWMRLPKRTRRGIRRRTWRHMKRTAKWSWRHARQRPGPQRPTERPDNWTWPVEAGGSTLLYRYFDDRERVLYIGITGEHRGSQRWQEHAESKPWYGQVAHCTIETFPTRADALYAEAVAIRDEKPLHNICRPDPARIGRP